MANIFITGSADGLGQLSAKELIKQGHHVVLHARNHERARQAMDKTPGAKNILVADLNSMEETKALASTANTCGVFDVVIHNAGIYNVSQKSLGREGLSSLLTVNTLAPYILTALMHKPQRLIYLSSGLHLQGDQTLENFELSLNSHDNNIGYSDTKFHDVILCMAAARRWPDVYANAVNPGWVPTRMGGTGAPDSFEEGIGTQVWLAVSEEPNARVTGKYFHHMRSDRFLPAAADPAVQKKFLALCEQATGIQWNE